MSFDNINSKNNDYLSDLQKVRSDNPVQNPESVKEQSVSNPIQEDIVKIYPEKSIYDYKVGSIYDKGYMRPLNISYRGCPKSKFNPHNFIKANSPEEVTERTKHLLTESDYKIATAGYSEPPEGYEDFTRLFLKTLDKGLGSENTAFITSPTMTEGSIDAITTEVEGFEYGTLIYMTSKDYIDFINTSAVPETIDSEDYENAPKYILPEQSKYSEATAKASNTFIAIGGRSATVEDFVNALKHGNKAVIVDNTSLKLPAWSENKNKVDNATRYLTEQIEAVKEGKPLPYPEVGEFTEQFIKDNMEKIGKLVRFYKVDNNPETIKDVATQAADFLKA